MQTPSTKTRTFDRAFSAKEREKGGARVVLGQGSPVDGAKPFEVYGFVGSIGSVVAYVVYIIWAYTPDSWLRAVGITYYPSRYWAIAVPAYLIISVLFICTLYLSLNFMATHPPQSPYSVYDEYSRPGMDPNLSMSHLNVDERPIIPSFSDMPLTEVNALLLGPALRNPLEKNIIAESHKGSTGRHCGPNFGVIEMRNNHPSKYTHAQEIVLLRADKIYEVGSVIKIQRCWKSYKERVIFRGIRSLIHSYEISNPHSVLRVINKLEASLADNAAGLHVRFRLDGREFPPTVVYKVYTHRPVVDLCSFSPRQYADGRRKWKETYLRWENNSWRPVTGTPAAQSGPKVKLEAQEGGAFFTHSLEERRILKLLDFKKRKRAWLMKLEIEIIQEITKVVFHLRKSMRHAVDLWLLNEQNQNFLTLYTVSRSQTAPAAVTKDLEGRAVTAPAAVSEHQEKWEGNVQGESFEDTNENVRPRALDLELLRWSAGLDYDEFEQDWYRMATSIPEEYDRDWCKLGTTFPRGYEPIPAVPTRRSSVACS